jgi:hypothetical protein
LADARFDLPGFLLDFAADAADNFRLFDAAVFLVELFIIFFTRRFTASTAGRTADFTFAAGLE